MFFNAQMFGGHGADPIVALLKYFNGNNRVFGADPEPVLLHLRVSHRFLSCMICLQYSLLNSTQPALMDENVELDEGALPRSDYTLIGEVERVCLFCSHSVSLHSSRFMFVAVQCPC